MLGRDKKEAKDTRIRASPTRLLMPVSRPELKAFWLL